jgi:hypothetical protein
MQGVVAVVGALTRNLASLQDKESCSSIYDNPSIILKVFNLGLFALPVLAINAIYHMI